MRNLTPFTLLYTAHLRGDLDRLPRLFTLLRTLRAEFSPRYLLDLGDSCTPDVWHCAVTEGRSMPIALDALGYTAMNVASLSASSRAKLVDQLTTALVDADHPHITDAVHFALHPVSDADGLQVLLAPADQTTLDPDLRRLALQAVNADQVGVVRVQINPESGLPELHSTEVRVLLPETPPDATIAGVVDFVVSEARYLQKRQQQ